MRNIKFYISMVMVIGLFLSVNSTSFAGERYALDVDNIKSVAEKHTLGGKAYIQWNAKVKNNTDKILTYKIKVHFRGSDDEKIYETTRIASIKPNSRRIVFKELSLDTSKVEEISSAYLYISKIDQTLTAEKDKDKMDANTGNIITIN